MTFKLYYSNSCKCCEEFKANVWNKLKTEYSDSIFQEINIDDEIIDVPLKGIPTVIADDKQITGNMTFDRFLSFLY